jgi:hypothetical protein
MPHVQEKYVLLELYGFQAEVKWSAALPSGYTVRAATMLRIRPMLAHSHDNPWKHRSNHYRISRDDYFESRLRDMHMGWPALSQPLVSGRLRVECHRGVPPCA